MLEKSQKNQTEVLDALRQPLDATRVGKRPGAGGKQLSYLEAHDVISEMNAVFGYDGWSDKTRELRPLPNETAPTCFYAIVDVTVKIGSHFITKSGEGYGTVLKGNVELGLKEAASDALKRACRKFGNRFGNVLYDKEAPEHRGQTRAAIATIDEMESYEDARSLADELGFKTEKGNAAKRLSGDVERGECLKRTEFLLDWIEANKPAEPEPKPPETFYPPGEPSSPKYTADGTLIDPDTGEILGGEPVEYPV